MTLYLLDTNAISDLITLHSEVRRNARLARQHDDRLGICRPVYYELLRGLYWRNASAKLATLHQQVLPLLTWVSLTDSDWEQAARFWADARRKGRQLADPDLLLAALTYRLGATLISSDGDYDILTITRRDWRL